MNEENGETTNVGPVGSGGWLGGREATGQPPDDHPAGAPLAGRRCPTYADDGPNRTWRIVTLGWIELPRRKGTGERSDPANKQS